jgi:hypothetical protein
MSTSRAVPTEDLKSSERPSPIESSQTSRGTAESGAMASSSRPEWTTQRWKLQVEAEARRRLKKDMQGVGAER